jgi:hypothetical protein
MMFVSWSFLLWSRSRIAPRAEVNPMIGRRGIPILARPHRCLRAAALAAGASLVVMSSSHPLRAQAAPSELMYLQQMRSDFVDHVKDVQTIFTINQGIFARIDSLLNHQTADTADAAFVRGTMNTRAYNLTIDAYRDILSGTYVSDPLVKLRVARHVARFDGLARERVRWAEQWDQTARPYMYDKGLLANPTGSHVLADPVFRSILLDRRNFARDVVSVTPGVLASADSVVAAIDAAIGKATKPRSY